MSFKGFVKDYFTFTKKDRIGTLLFVLFVAGCLFLPRLLAPKTSPLVLEQDSSLAVTMDTLQNRKNQKPAYSETGYARAYQFEPSSQKSFTNGELFEFDPNTATIRDWQRLGLNDKTSRTILNYISKGGKFRKPEDLQKIWGMPKEFYERVKDYVVIEQSQKNFARYEYSKPKFEREERNPVVVNINDADTSAFIALPGIGSKLSARIVAFREKLGGFYSIDQIGETYGLPDSTFQKIKSRLQANENGIRKINLNTATKDELKVHPYIRWNLANAIVEYRNQHGAFKSLGELKNIVLIDETTFNKISHYLIL